MKNSESATPLPPEPAGDEGKELFVKGKDFLEMYTKVAEFTKELVARNAELKQQLQELQREREQIVAGARGEPEQKLLERLEQLKQERQEILNRYHQKEEENKDFFDRFLEIAEQMCDRIGIIQEGKLIAEGAMPELKALAKREGTLEEIFLSLTSGEDVQEIIASLKV